MSPDSTLRHGLKSCEALTNGQTVLARQSRKVQRQSSLRIVPILLEEKSGCLSGDECVNCLLDHARRIVVSAIPHGQQAVPSEAADGQDCDAFLTPSAEEAVCTAPMLRFYLTMFLVCVFSARSVSGSAVLHWYRRQRSSVRHPAALGLERSESDEKTWTTVPSTMRMKERTRPPRAGTWSSDAWSGFNGGSLHSRRERMSDCRSSQLANA